MRHRRLARVLPLVLIAALVPVLALVGSGPASAAESVDLVDRAYTPLNPARILDTRTGLGSGGPVRVGAGGVIDLQVTGAGGVPASGVDAVVFNLTGTGPSAGTYVTAFPAGQPRPTASNLNLLAGQTIPNLVVAKVGAGGKVSLYNDKGSIDLIVDVVGWFATGPDFTGLVPARVLDTRTGLGGGPVRKVGPKASIDVQVAGAGGVPASGAGAVVFNLTGTGPTAATYVTAFPAGETRPTASNLNLLPGQTAPNLVVAKVGAGGKVTLYNDSGSTDLIVDVVGWLAVGSDYSGVNPARVLDTRSGLGAAARPVAAKASVDVQVTGVGGVPADGVGAVVFNLTGTQPTAATYVTAYPTGETRPNASNLNLLAGQTAPNLVVAKVGAGGKVTLYNDSGATHLIVDVVGWISTGVAVHLDKPATTEIVDPAAVTAIAPGSGDVTVTGAAPSVGEIVFVPPAAQTGDGLLGKVVGATAGGGGTTLHTTPVLITEAFPSGQISGSLDTRALAPGAVASSAKSLAGRALQVDEDGQVNATATNAATPCGGSVLQVDVGLDVSARVVVEVSWGFGKLDRLKFAFQLEVAGHITVTAGLSVKCEFPVGPKIRMGAIWGFVPELQPTLKVELLGGVTETAEVKGTIDIGAEYNDGSGIRWIHKGGLTGRFTEPNESVSGKLKVAFGPKLALKFAGIVGPALFGALFLETTLTPLANPWWKTDAGVTAEGSFDVDLWFTNVSYTLTAFDVLRFELSRASGGWPGPKLTNGDLPGGTVGRAYSAAVPVTGGQPPYTARVTGGALPAGLALNGTTVAGTPTASGTATVTIEARDANNRTASATFRLPVTTPASTQFTMTSTAGRAGAGVFLSSVKPCPAPPAGQDMWVTATLVDAAGRSWPTYSQSTRADGGWDGYLLQIPYTRALSLDPPYFADEAATGAATINVTCASGNDILLRYDPATFTVTGPSPKVQASTTSVTPGSTLRVTPLNAAPPGTQFGYVVLQNWVGNYTNVRFTPDAQGNWPATTLQVPAFFTPGTYQLGVLFYVGPQQVPSYYADTFVTVR